jgi:hypothetical protein
LRDWLRDDDNADFVEESQRETEIERMNQFEEWLYEDGADANYTVFDSKAKNLTALIEKFEGRKAEFE